ncbi:hypothetical protein BDZ97DRAFT_1847920 [Flammula alnicola]|nr:hypothetical protein BDZ97DRAFT_1847920 [Flammula alnicola]
MRNGSHSGRREMKGGDAYGEKGRDEKGRGGLCSRFDVNELTSAPSSCLEAAELRLTVGCPTHNKLWSSNRDKGVDICLLRENEQRHVNVGHWAVPSYFVIISALSPFQWATIMYARRFYGTSWPRHPGVYEPEKKAYSGWRRTESKLVQGAA